MTGREGETFPGFFHAWGELPDMGPCGCSLSGKRRRSRRAHCHGLGERGMRASQAHCRRCAARNGSPGCLWLKTLPGYPRGGNAAFGEWGSMPSKKNTNIFLCFSGMLIEQSVRRGQNLKFFCGKMLDGGVEKAHKAVRANELATSERATGKENFPDGKKVLDAGLKMRHKSPSRQRVAPTGPRKKLSRNEKNLLTAKTKRRKQLLRAELIGVVH